MSGRQADGRCLGGFFLQFGEGLPQGPLKHLPGFLESQKEGADDEGHEGRRQRGDNPDGDAHTADFGEEPGLFDWFDSGICGVVRGDGRLDGFD